MQEICFIAVRMKDMILFLYTYMYNIYNFNT